MVILAKLIPISVNPNYNGPLGSFGTCTSPSGDEGTKSLIYDILFYNSYNLLVYNTVVSPLLPKNNHK